MAEGQGRVRLGGQGAGGGGQCAERQRCGGGTEEADRLFYSEGNGRDRHHIHRSGVPAGVGKKGQGCGDQGGSLRQTDQRCRRGSLYFL